MIAKIRRQLLIAVPIALLLLPVVVYLIDRAATSSEVTRNITAGPVDLGGLSEPDALAAIQRYEAELRSKPAVFLVDGQEFALTGADAGLDIDEEKAVALAMEQRRDGIFSDFKGWFGSFNSSIRLPLTYSIDEDALNAVLQVWEDEAIGNPAFEGAIVVSDGRALPEYPRAGQKIDRAAAQAIALNSLSTEARLPAPIPVVAVEPELTAGDLDAAAQEANLLISDPITLVSDDPPLEITFEPEDLAIALDAEVVMNSPVTINIGFKDAFIKSYLVERRDEIERPPSDARWVLNDDDTVVLIPSRAETVLDETLVSSSLHEIALAGTGVGPFPFAFGQQPEFSTEAAQAMGAIELESSFTTNHPVGQKRVINIQLMADTVKGHILWPGETFSLNEFIGQRTNEKGYVLAPMLLHGELVDSVGGGVSQFATTFYNAVFFGCYEDIEHTPHSRYFSRYPEGREATISWQQPDLKFRNNSDAIILMDTQYTRDSITVRFFGNNGGLACESLRSGRFGFRTPDTEFEADPTVTPGTEAVDSNGRDGWAITSTRVITHPDGIVEEEKLTHRYQTNPKKVRVHPCDMEGSTEECPIVITSVIGLSLGDATATLGALGFSVVEGAVVPVESEDLNGKVTAQSPAAGDFLPAGSTVTVNLGVYEPPEEEVDP